MVQLFDYVPTKENNLTFFFDLNILTNKNAASNYRIIFASEKREEKKRKKFAIKIQFV
jgi:hypothetical protein